MDRYPPQEDGALRYPPHGGGHGAPRQWQPREAGAGQERRSFLSNARARRKRIDPPWWWRPWLRPWFAARDWWYRERPVRIPKP